MLQINIIRENPENVINRLKVRHFDAREIVGKIIEIDNQRRNIQKELDDTNANSKSLAKKIGQLVQEKKIDEANSLKLKTSFLKEKAKRLSDELRTVEQELKNLVVQFPNLPHINVPIGRTADDNKIILQEGEIPELPDDAKPHWELAVEYDIIDFEAGNKITASSFPFYKAKGAKLERALINFFLDEAISASYTEYIPPLLVNEESAFATGQLPDKDDLMYHTEPDNFFLIPTAEVPITNIHRDKIYKVEELPIKNVAYTPCFRREAGSYGKNVRGLNRIHQFDKVEIVQIQTPDKSYQALEEMVQHAINLLRKLELTFRVVLLCGGEMSFASALTYDLEVYSAAQKKWLEVSSVTNFETFQSNRLHLRYKDEKGKIHLAHTLNGSALALPRIVAALLENNQTPDGIKIPSALVKYTGFEILK